MLKWGEGAADLGEEVKRFAARRRKEDTKREEVMGNEQGRESEGVSRRARMLLLRNR